MSCFVQAAIFINNRYSGNYLLLASFITVKKIYFGTQYGGLAEKINVYFMKKTVKIDLYRFFLN